MTRSGGGCFWHGMVLLVRGAVYGLGISMDRGGWNFLVADVGFLPQVSLYSSCLLQQIVSDHHQAFPPGRVVSAKFIPSFIPLLTPPFNFISFFLSFRLDFSRSFPDPQHLEIVRYL